MKIEMEECGRLKIVMDSTDMDTFNITFEELDYETPQTRKVIFELLTLARRKYDFYPDSGSLLVEVFPCGKGGCMIYFTGVEKSKSAQRLRLRKKEMGPYIFAFEDTSDMMNACCRLWQRGLSDIEKSRLYVMDHTYYLLIYPLFHFSLQLKNALCEYGKLYAEGSSAAAHIEEFGELIEEDAVDRIASVTCSRGAVY